MSSDGVSCDTDHVMQVKKKPDAVPVCVGSTEMPASHTKGNVTLILSLIFNILIIWPL